MSRAKGATLKPFSSAKAMKPDRLGGGVRYECQLTAGTAIGHDVAAADITAELDVHLLDHAFMMAGGTVCANHSELSAPAHTKSAAKL